jgi:hypothetical protein
MMPTTWRYEMIEAWFPQSSWNPSESRIEFAADNEPFDGMTHYAANEGAYYAARLAVTEMLDAQGRSAAVIVLREIHPGYDIPLGVWNIRENVREALRHPPVTGESLEQLWPHIESYMDVRRETWFSHSAVLKDWKVQRRIEDYYRASFRNPYIRDGSSYHYGQADGRFPGRRGPPSASRPWRRSIRCRGGHIHPR